MSTGKHHMEFIVGGTGDDSDDLQMLIRPDALHTADIVLPAAFDGGFQQSSDASEIMFLRSRGTRNVPENTQQNDPLGYITFKSYSGGTWNAAAQIYGVLEEDVTENPNQAISGGKIIFATTEKGTSSTHELVDRMTIDSNGRIWQRSTAQTGVANLINSNSLTTGTAMLVQSANLTTGIGLHVTTEISYLPPKI